MPASSSAPLLDRRTLNRTLLARQHLLERVRSEPLAVVDQLVGLQAQEPIDPYVGLWTRVADFDPLTLSDAMTERRAARIGLMRTTLHLVTAADALGLAPLMDDVLRRVFRSTPFAKRLAGVDGSAVVAAAREAIEQEPLAPAELGRRLAARWPDADPASLAYLARYHLPLVQVPPRGLWQRSGRATNTTLEAWTGRQPAAFAVEDVVRRYLRAFGPATVGDIRTWSWMTGLRPIVEALRPALRTYRDERGRELFDIEDGILADPDEPAPVRLLPQYDNVFLSHEDRSRILIDDFRIEELAWRGGVLVDGFVSGGWRVTRSPEVSTMTVTVKGPLSDDIGADLTAEADRLLAFLAADERRREVRIEPVIVSDDRDGG